MPVKVVLAGPPRSGKSCLRQGLREAIKAIPGAPYPFVITACPDGEGAWFQEAAARDPELAARCKAAYKGKFTPEFVARIAESVRRCPLPLTLVDVGGIPSAENSAICQAATHVVFLAADLGHLEEWRPWAAALGLGVVAEIESAYEATQDRVDAVDGGVLRGSVHHLERGEDITSRPLVSALAHHLVALAQGEK